ncbi:MAG: coproporphyrinogen III oxidase family protein, partial [Calditrichaeota bacterium]
MATQSKNSRAAALYIHIPFCAKRCDYCDFYTVANQEHVIPSYLAALQKEIAQYAEIPHWQNQNFSTIYFGGGTPSLLSPQQVQHIIEILKNAFTFAHDTEVTFEVNPGSTTRENMQGYVEAGVNRISIGAQSFLPDELQQLDRLHSVDETITTVESARVAGIDNLSIDLIFALPRQRPSRWRYSLERAIALQPEHISAYNLTIEQGTPLQKSVAAGKVHPMSEWRQRLFYDHTIGFLEQHGYSHYEVSNYSKPGFESRHNSKYWDGSFYLGLGASAHSFDGARRFWNVRSFAQYIKKLQNAQLPIAGEEILTQPQREFETIMLGLRQKSGLDVQDFEHIFQIDFQRKYHKQLAKLTMQNPPLLNWENSRLALTREGWLLCDAVCAEFA